MHSRFSECCIGKLRQCWLDLPTIPAWCCRSDSAARDSPHLQVHWERTMSIFGKIMSAIFGTKADAAPAGGGAALPRIVRWRRGRPVRRCGTGRDGRRRTDPRQGGRSQGREAGVAHLDRRPDEGARHRFQLSARKELAKELGYTGDSNDSASMNIWLHKQVMTQARRQWRQAAA